MDLPSGMVNLFALLARRCTCRRRAVHDPKKVKNQQNFHEETLQKFHLRLSFLSTEADDDVAARKCLRRCNYKASKY